MRTLITIFIMAAGAAVAGGQGRAPNGLRKGNWRPQDVPESYVCKKIGRYQLQSNCREDVVDRVGLHLNTMFKVYKKFSPPTKTPKSRLVVKLFDSRDGFLSYGASPGSAGFYSDPDKEMVGYNTGVVAGVATVGGTTDSGGDGHVPRARRQRFSMDTIGVFSHEGWHQYFHWSCGSKVPFPAWADEGIGDYFYTAYLDENDAIVLGAPMDGRLERIQAAIAASKHVPLEEFVQFDTRRYYARQRGQNYAQGWSLIHFFMEHPDYRKKRYPQRFVKVFKDQHSIEKTVPQVFGRRVKWKKMEEDWKTWILAMPQRIYDDDEPEMVMLAEAANERAKGHRAKMKPHVRAALQACLDKRPGAARKRPAAGAGERKGN